MKKYTQKQLKEFAELGLAIDITTRFKGYKIEPITDCVLL